MPGSERVIVMIENENTKEKNTVENTHVQNSESEDMILKLEHVSKIYGLNRPEAEEMMRNGADKADVFEKTGCTVALWDINLEIPKGRIFVLIGLSGSGKSTAVRCINRLTTPTGGRILYNGRDINELNAKELIELRRYDISMVFQSFGLMNHRNVLENVAYGLEIKGMNKTEREQQAMKYIAMVGLEGMEYQSCGQLSGGMKQRVGIARALATESEILLMDEPFSALDPLVRRDMQFELLKIQRKLGRTIVFITHDVDEAFKLGDMVCIMKNGKVIQVGSPEELMVSPATPYVDRFLDSADKTKVVTVSNIMITPSSMVRVSDNIDWALREMRRNNLSTVVVIDKNMRLCGALSIHEALIAKQNGKSVAEAVDREILTVSPDALISDIIPMASSANLPIAVVDENRTLLGLVTKSRILATI